MDELTPDLAGLLQGARKMNHTELSVALHRHRYKIAEDVTAETERPATGGTVRRMGIGDQVDFGGGFVNSK